MKQQKIPLVAHGLCNKNVNKIQLKTGKKIPANWCEKTTRCELGCVPDTPVNIYMLKNPLHPHPPSAEDWCVPRFTAFGARVWNSSPLTLENQNDLPKNQNKPQKSPKNQCDELRAFGGTQGRGMNTPSTLLVPPPTIADALAGSHMRSLMTSIQQIRKQTQNRRGNMDCSMVRGAGISHLGLICAAHPYAAARVRTGSGNGCRPGGESECVAAECERRERNPRERGDENEMNRRPENDSVRTHVVNKLLLLTCGTSILDTHELCARRLLERPCNPVKLRPSGNKSLPNIRTLTLL